MKIKVYKFGKPIHSAYDQLYEHFSQRLKTLAKFEFEIRKLSQGDQILGTSEIAALNLGEAHLPVLLDEEGQQFQSEQFAKRLEALRNDPHVKQLTILVGGPYGFTADLKREFKERWSLSKALMPSDLATVVLLEQLYRGLTILKGSGYHHP